MRTCRELGIPTVAVYAEPDARAPHVYFADEQVQLEGPSPRQAYLDIEQLIRVAHDHRADAIHPGYGFLSENPAFAEACATEGLTFIGPSAASMRAMGNKVESRRRMTSAGVPVVPGTAAIADEAAALVEAKRIGYPVMVKAAAAVGYQNAGTVEFRVSGDDFYFLEMNTRLQVEHPVTESVLGVDLVREQIRVARRERLPSDGYPAPRGHAIEFRINAEDPLRNFMPAPRRVLRYAPPTGPGVRVDSGIRPHQEISAHFDSLLLKLIVWAEDRPAAIGRGRRALQELVLTGPKTTVPFHRALLDEPDFVHGRISTGFIDEHPGLLERTKAFATEGSPLEPLYGGGEIAAVIAAGVVVAGER